MAERTEVRLAVFTAISSVILAILYDVLQESWKWYYLQSPTISNNTLLVNVYSKIPAGTITILVGLLLLIWIYRNYLKRPEINVKEQKRKSRSWWNWFWNGGERE